MKRKKDQEDVSANLRVAVPKNFEYKVLGKLILDLEELVEQSHFEQPLYESLRCDLIIATDVVRRRNGMEAASLANRLITQSTIARRTIHSEQEALAFYIQYQLGAFLKKYPFKGVDTKSPAVRSFIAAEHQCRLFNKENYKALVKMDTSGHRLFGDSIVEIRQDIEKLLGAIPNTLRVGEDAAHGPGVSLGDQYKEGESTSYFKWRHLPYSVTQGAMELAKETILKDPRWIGALDYWYRDRCNNWYGPIDLDDFWSRVLTVVDASRITTVPKSGLTDRTIAIEPLMNVFLQLGVDKFLKKRLKKLWNYDLTSQELNQHLARIGAADGSYATIDLKAASDTISLMICQMFLPEAWFDLLLDLRSPKGELNGFKGSFEKISSMGNGYTFALESLIFGAVVRHVQRRRRNRSITAVFGDDLVVPTEIASDVIDFLQYCGFTINREKSFITGPFRESCGTDWFLTHNVRPVFLTKACQTVLDLFYLHNRFVEFEEDADWSWCVHFKETRAFIRKYIPSSFGNVFGPRSESLDTHLFSDRRIPGVGLNDRWHQVIVPVARKFNRDTDFLFRKLMVSLKGSPTCAENYKWDRRKKLTRGNSFDVTKKEYVGHVLTKKVVYVY